MSSQLRSRILFAGGCLLVILGMLHLAVTTLIASMVRDAAKPDSADWLVPPMLLNHVVVGVLLLPLGFLTAYAAPRAAKAVRWALVICRSTSITIAALPPVLFFLMDTRYFAARPFQFAIGIVCTASVALLLATFWPAERLAVDHERSST